jgi:ribosomal-protein-alanine N-acetyltransferase
MGGSLRLKTSGRRKTKKNYQIRRAEAGDLDKITELEAIVFLDPWPRESFEQSLNDTFLVAFSDCEIIGYVISRIAGVEGEVLSLGVSPGWRKRGVGKCLFQDSTSLLEEAGLEDLFLEVRESNEVAKLFYSGLGFHQVGMRTNYYRFPRENALILRRKIFPD